MQVAYPVSSQDQLYHWIHLRSEAPLKDIRAASNGPILLNCIQDTGVSIRRIVSIQVEVQI